MEFLENLFGLHTEKLTIYHMTARTIVVFFIALFLIRFAAIRTLGKQSAFDQLTALMLGAIMARSVVDIYPSFFDYIIVIFVIMLLHRIIAWITFHNRKAGFVFKGGPLLLMKEGILFTENMQKTNITEEDILEALRRDMHVNSLNSIKEVYLERSGKISFIIE